jgi:hypothetical protein
MRPVIVIRVSIEAALRFPSPENCAGVDVVGLPVVFVVEEPPTELPVRVKFAQVIRVLLAKWTVMDRFPKKAPIPGRVEG